MSDDIVTRLREKYSGQLPICAEASDEIERLREQNEYLKENVEMLLAEAKSGYEDDIADLGEEEPF